jgi:hypothetical protein
MFAFVATVGLGEYLFAGMIVGSVFSFLGLKELRKYCPMFIFALIGSISIFICSLFEALIFAKGFVPIVLPDISTAVNIAKLIVYLYFDITMLLGIIDLSRRVDYNETREKATRNIIYVCIFNACQIVTLTPLMSYLADDDRSAVMTLLMILQIIYTCINAFLLFKCYAMICPAGQEDMPRKKSRFAFVNKFREIRDAKEEKAIEDMKNYYEDKLKKKNSKKKHKKK